MREKAILERLYAEAKQESIEIADKSYATEKDLEHYKKECDELSHKLAQSKLK